MWIKRDVSIERLKYQEILEHEHRCLNLNSNSTLKIESLVTQMTLDVGYLEHLSIEKVFCLVKDIS